MRSRLSRCALMLLALLGWAASPAAQAARLAFTDNGDGTAEIYLLTELEEGGTLLSLDIPIHAGGGVTGFTPAQTGDLFGGKYPGPTGGPVGPLDVHSIGGLAVLSAGISVSPGVLYWLGTVEWSGSGEVAAEGVYIAGFFTGEICLPPRGTPLVELSALPADSDGDTLLDDVDPCPSYPNTSLDDPDADGIPTECQCGDFDQDGFFANNDVTLAFGCVPGSPFPTPPAQCAAALDVGETNHSLSYDNSDISTVFGFVPGTPFPNAFEPWATTCARRPEGTVPPVRVCDSQETPAPDPVPVVPSPSCVTDTDGDGLCDDEDPCIFYANTNLADTIGNGIPDECRCGDANDNGYFDNDDAVFAYGCAPGSPFPTQSELCASRLDKAETNHANDYNKDFLTIFGAVPGSPFPNPFPSHEMVCARRPEGTPPP